MNAVADRLKIIELLGKHQITIDLGDADAYADLYTPHGRYESPFATARGREDISEMSMRLARAGFTEGKRHLIGPMIIEVDGDEARAFSYWWVAETKEAPGIYSTGTYTDRLQKIDGEWKIAHRKQEIDPNWHGGETAKDPSG
jgi:ketosteroid isomerase-like protein